MRRRSKLDRTIQQAAQEARENLLAEFPCAEADGELARRMKEGVRQRTGGDRTSRSRLSRIATVGACAAALCLLGVVSSKTTETGAGGTARVWQYIRIWLTGDERESLTDPTKPPQLVDEELIPRTDRVDDLLKDQMRVHPEEDWLYTAEVSVPREGTADLMEAERKITAVREANLAEYEKAMGKAGKLSESDDLPWPEAEWYYYLGAWLETDRQRQEEQIREEAVLEYFRPQEEAAAAFLRSEGIIISEYLSNLSRTAFRVRLTAAQIRMLCESRPDWYLRAAFEPVSGQILLPDSREKLEASPAEERFDLSVNLRADYSNRFSGETLVTSGSQTNRELNRPEPSLLPRRFASFEAYKAALDTGEQGFPTEEELQAAVRAYEDRILTRTGLGSKVGERSWSFHSAYITMHWYAMGLCGEEEFFAELPAGFELKGVTREETLRLAEDPDVKAIRIEGLVESFPVAE